MYVLPSIFLYKKYMYYASDNKCVENRYKDNAKPYV